MLVAALQPSVQYVDRRGVITGPDGRFVFPVPAGSSRLLRLAYRAYLGDDAYATRSTSTLNTRARISVRGPRHVRRHGVAKFSGRLVGRPFPPRGTYRFCLKVVRQAGLPFHGGVSPVASVAVRP